MDLIADRGPIFPQIVRNRKDKTGLHQGIITRPTKMILGSKISNLYKRSKISKLYSKITRKTLSLLLQESNPATKLHLQKDL